MLLFAETYMYISQHEPIQEILVHIAFVFSHSSYSDAQLSSGARVLILSLCLHLPAYVSSEGSVKTWLKCRLV